MHLTLVASCNCYNFSRDDGTFSNENDVERAEKGAGGYCHTLSCYIQTRAAPPCPPAVFSLRPKSTDAALCLLLELAAHAATALDLDSSSPWSPPPEAPTPPTSARSSRIRSRNPPPKRFVGGEKHKKRKKDMFWCILWDTGGQRSGGEEEQNKRENIKPIREAPKLNSCKLPRIML